MNLRQNTSDPVWDATTELLVTEHDVLEFKISDYDEIGQLSWSNEATKVFEK